MAGFAVTRIEPAAMDQPPPRAWFLILGLTLAALGAVAAGNLLEATFVSVFVLGSLMLIGAVSQIAHALAARRWDAFGIWLLSGLLYLGAGFAVFHDPLFAARAFTLLLAFCLFLSGLLRVWIGWQDGQVPLSGWLAVSGLLTVLASVAVLLGWPLSSAWALGLFLACDLLWLGVTFTLVGLAPGVPARI